MSAPDTTSLHRLDRATRWRLEAAVDVGGDVGHPQGLTSWGDHWLVSTVRPTEGRGELLIVDRHGSVLDRLDVTDGERFHSGGIASEHGGCWVPVAEYRSASTTTVLHVDGDLRPTVGFRFTDHLGAVCPLADGTLLAVSWGGRTLYRLSGDGIVLGSRPNPTFFVDHQDLTVVDAHTVVATGIGVIAGPQGKVQLGGLAIIDADELAPVREAPVQAWMPSGRVITYNGAHLDLADGAVRVHCLVDDRSAVIATWVEQRA
ncbi:MAG TPA: DUF6454 family protein [Acidimicrobiales bacterium]|nr:DUF6454 family protein [Acidimicrobiales bacterium]